MSLTRDGGKPNVKSANYSPPRGPTNQMRDSPGLGGSNMGQCGSQGKHTITTRESGSVGLGGSRMPHGTQK